MTLDKLIEQLELLRNDLGGDALAIVAKDSEGNDFQPVYETEIAMYVADSAYSGTRYMTEADRLAETEPDEYEKAPDDAVRAVFLWPTN